MGRFGRFDRGRQERDTGPRTNRRIRVREVMVIDHDGGNLGVMPTDVALKRAEDAGLDLVEVAPEARPPVCKILDYGKYKYQQKKKQAEAKRHQTHQELKEVKLRPKTDDHDYDFKLKHCRRFLEGGDKVKVTVMFRGREVIHKDIAYKRLKKIAVEVEDLGKVEVEPRMEGRTMHMIVAPKAGAKKPRTKDAPKKSKKQAAADKTPTEEKGAPDAKAEKKPAPETGTEEKAKASVEAEPS